jgi:hypothetical protein
MLPHGAAGGGGEGGGGRFYVDMAMYAEEAASSSLSEEAGQEAVDSLVGGLDAWARESDGAAGMRRGDGDDYDDLLLVDGRA